MECQSLRQSKMQPTLQDCLERSENRENILADEKASFSLPVFPVDRALLPRMRRNESSKGIMFRSSAGQFAVSPPGALLCIHRSLVCAVLAFVLENKKSQIPKISGKFVCVCGSRADHSQFFCKKSAPCVLEF